MCHRAHRADTDPLVEIGLKDITSHLDFTALALAGQTRASMSSAMPRRRTS
jgi:SAM-dependent MidA family methyltransferase